MFNNCNRCDKMRQLQRIVASDSDFYADLCDSCVALLRERFPNFDSTESLPPVPEHIKTAPYQNTRHKSVVVPQLRPYWEKEENA